MASAEQQINALVATATRLGLLDFTAVDDMDQAGRRRQMVGRIQQIFEGCMGVVTPTKFGKAGSNGLKGRPEYATMLKCVEASSRLWALQAAAEKGIRDEGESRGVEIQQLLSLLRSMGYEVKEPTKAA